MDKKSRLFRSLGVRNDDRYDDRNDDQNDDRYDDRNDDQYDDRNDDQYDGRQEYFQIGHSANW